MQYVLFLVILLEMKAKGVEHIVSVLEHLKIELRHMIAFSTGI